MNRNIRIIEKFHKLTFSNDMTKSIRNQKQTLFNVCDEERFG